MPNLIVSAVSTFDNKGLKKGQKEITAFEKRIKSFAKAFAAAFSVRALTTYSKKAVAAFAEDEKAAKSLELQLKNTGFQFSSPAVEMYIANLQRTTGVLDDQLRPALQQLLTVTGSITTSQDALNTALNVSAATGKSLSVVSTSLTRAFAGNTTGLSRLGAGLDKNLLKTGNMDEIMGELNKKFAGQSAARLTTYAGKMDLLAAASADAQEIIGKGILDSLSLLSEDNTIEDLTKGMEDFAIATSEVIVGIGQVASKLKSLTNVPGLGNIFDVKNIPVIGAYLGGLRDIGRAAMPQQDRGGVERSATRISAQQRKLEAQAIKSSVSLRKAENDLLKKKTAVDQLRDKFDLERIGLTAALNAATDSETKLRLRAQLAILDNNEALAKKLLAEMEGTKATEILTTQFYALSEAAKQLLLSFGVDPSQIGPGGTIVGGSGGRSNIANLANTSINNPAFASSAAGMDLGLALGFTPGSRTGSSAPTEVIVTVNTASGGDKLSQAIAESIQIATRNGFSTVPAGQGF